MKRFSRLINENEVSKLNNYLKDKNSNDRIKFLNSLTNRVMRKRQTVVFDIRGEFLIAEAISFSFTDHVYFTLYIHDKIKNKSYRIEPLTISELSDIQYRHLNETEEKILSDFQGMIYSIREF